MRFSDLLTLPVAALWQQKLRTTLTTLGVVFGAFVLAASLSIGEGVQETIDRESHRADVARRVEVFAKWNQAAPGPEADGAKVEGEMDEARRERIRKALAERRQRGVTQARTELTRPRLDAIAALPGVERMVPLIYNDAFALLGGKSEGVQIVSARPDDESCRRRVVAGRFFDAPDERAVVVSEFLAYRLGLADDAAIDGLVGKKLRLEFHSSRAQPGVVVYLFKPGEVMSREESAAIDRLTARLPESFEAIGLSKDEADVLRAATRKRPAKPEVFSEEFAVVGVMRAPTREEQEGPWDPLRADGDVLMPYRAAMDLYFRDPKREDIGANLAVLTAESEEGVKGLAERVKALGLEARAAVEFIERERLIYLLIFGGMTCVAGVALLVSAVGIANTMLMSVLERTREIGIMKAVGADDRHLLFVFLAEGGLIGLIGAGAGLLLAWGASFPADAWVRSMVLRDIKIDLKESIFVFPPWMAGVVLLFTVLVTTLAAFYPARHAARIDPVAALRHE